MVFTCLVYAASKWSHKNSTCWILCTSDLYFIYYCWWPDEINLKQVLTVILSQGTYQNYLQMNCKEVSIPYAHLFLRLVKSNLSGCFCFCPKIFTKTFTLDARCVCTLRQRLFEFKPIYDQFSFQLQICGVAPKFQTSWKGDANEILQINVNFIMTRWILWKLS